jgi:hypothetical protein
MSLIHALTEKPADLSLASRYMALNGIIYLCGGAVLLSWPRIQAILGGVPGVDSLWLHR